MRPSPLSATSSATTATQPWRASSTRPAPIRSYGSGWSGSSPGEPTRSSKNDDSCRVLFHAILLVAGTGYGIVMLLGCAVMVVGVLTGSMPIQGPNPTEWAFGV